MMVQTPNRVAWLEARLAAAAMSVADKISRWAMDLHRWGIVGRRGVRLLLCPAAWLRRAGLRLILGKRRRR